MQGNLNPSKWALLAATLLAAANPSRAQHQSQPTATANHRDNMKTATPTMARHPFLICTRDDFPELRRRAEREPWKQMATDALARVAAGPPTDDKPVPLQNFLGACALAYILAPDDAKAHAQRVRQAIVEGLAAVDFDPAKQHLGSVPPMGAAFVAILALDIVYDDLAGEEIAACEAVIEAQIGKIDRRGAWPGARLGTHGTWDIYKGKRTTPDQEFYQDYLKQMTPDGVTTVSPGYAFARLGAGNDRPQKSAYADVLEFTGIDRRYYNHPRLQAFYRWLFSASVTPARQYHLFGDVSPNWKWPNSPLVWRVGRFDRQAAAYAAWLLEGKQPPGHILSYVLMQEPLPAPAVPQSQLFSRGGAVLREVQDSPTSLGAALYNITENDEWHTHEEVNAISLAAYGNRLLVNGGWLGEPMRPPWKNNTLAIDGQRHQRRTGGGLAEGLLAKGFDYACGDSGQAIKEASFRRSLVLIHRQHDCGGYFIVFDEVKTQPDRKVHLYLQTASVDQAETVHEHTEYRSKINHHADLDGVAMTVFYATQPAAVAQETVESGFLERIPTAGHHNRLESVYPVDAQGHRRLATIFFPHDADHPKAAFSRLAADNAQGAKVDFGNGVTDLIFAADGKQRIETEGVAFQAEAVVCRQGGDGHLFYFARRGRQLTSGAIGFQSSQPVSIHMRGREGKIVSPTAVEITFHYPNGVGLRLDGQPVETTVGDGWLRLELPAGTHEIALDTKP